MSEKNYTEDWKRLFRDNCLDWDPHLQQRYINICNDPTAVDKEEFDSCKELVQEINGEIRKAG